MANEQYSESTDSTDYYDSDDSNKSFKSSSLRNNSENYKSSTSKPSDIRRVLVFTNLKPTLVAKTDNTAPKSVPPRLPGPSPWSAPLQDNYIDVYVDGAEIEAATIAAQQAHEAGIKKLRIKTDSKVGGKRLENVRK